MLRPIESKKLALCIGLVMAGLCTAAWGDPLASFTGVGVLPGDATSNANSVSRDGKYVTGDSTDATGPQAFIYVTGTGAKTAIGFPPSWTTSSGEGIDSHTVASVDYVYVAGTGKNASAKDQAFYYDATLTTFTAIPFLTGGDSSLGHAIECDFTGQVLMTGRSNMTPPAGHGSPFYHAYRWRTGAPAASLNLADPPTDGDGNGNLAEGWCLGIRPSGDTVIRGSTTETSYPCGGHNPMGWTWYSGDSTTAPLWWAMTGLSCPLPSGTNINSDARGTSADGRYIVGASTVNGAVCGTNREAYLVDTDDNDLYNTCHPTGGSVAGYLQYCIRTDCAWGSKMLGSLPGHEGRSEGLGVSLDGGIVVGWARKLDGSCTFVDSGNTAFIWDATNGMRDVKVVLEGLGLNLTGWVLTEARSVSSDGTVICGVGTHNGVAEGWVATIGRAGSIGACCHADLTCSASDLPSCSGTFHPGQTCATAVCCHTPFADSEGDGDVDQDDFGAFQVCYTGTAGGVPTGCACFDRNTDGNISDADYLAFSNCWTGPNVPWSQTLTPSCNP